MQISSVTLTVDWLIVYTLTLPHHNPYSVPPFPAVLYPHTPVVV